MMESHYTLEKMQELKTTLKTPLKNRMKSLLLLLLCEVIKQDMQVTPQKIILSSLIIFFQKVHFYPFWCIINDLWSIDHVVDKVECCFCKRKTINNKFISIKRKLSFYSPWCARLDCECVGQLYFHISFLLTSFVVKRVRRVCNYTMPLSLQLIYQEDEVSHAEISHNFIYVAFTLYQKCCFRSLLYFKGE